MDNVTSCQQLPENALQELLEKYGLNIISIPSNEPIPGSYWGESEAGLIGTTLYVRDDTPVHSALHETCHYICMDSMRRNNLHTDAGGHYDEENGVCYLQILLADHLAEMNKEIMMRDMDNWGYSFRLGSATSWFHNDAEDAKSWLLNHGLIDHHNQPTWKLRH
ncbi:MAG: hypothetical protein OEZ33_02650 [Gammaproteobacteria bacterium]|nr:hypothetical protein [Gammaproteobacteria bacterium]MDH5777088.1 hypothetical protein [Gammaproteobacteria bacterium]